MIHRFHPFMTLLSQIRAEGEEERHNYIQRGSQYRSATLAPGPGRGWDGGQTHKHTSVAPNTHECQLRNREIDLEWEREGGRANI